MALGRRVIGDAPETAITSGSQLFKRWFGKGAWAVMDQGLYAGSNFVINILLARWLAPREYGAFTLAFMVFLLVGTFHTSLLTEPMLVFGPGKYRDRIPEYLGVLVSGHAILAGIGGLLLVLVAAAIRLWGTSVVPVTLAGLGITAPFILFFWLMRRACYLRLQPNLAAAGGAVNLAFVVVGLIVLYQHGWLSTISALGLMGLGGLMVSVWLAGPLRVRRPALMVSAFARETFKIHWDYGRWLAATMTLAWLPRGLYYVLLPAARGLEAGATLKAMMNFILPALNLSTALSVLLVPSLVRFRGNDDLGRRLIRLVLVLLTAGSAGYWVLLALFHRPLMMWIYRGQYAAPPGMWLLMLVVLIAGGVDDVLGSALRALERPDQVFRANVHSTAATLTVGLWCTFRWGVWGAGVGLAVSSLVRALATCWYYWRSSRSGPGLQRSAVGSWPRGRAGCS